MSCFTCGHQRPGLASNCQAVVREQKEKQGLAFLIFLFETGYLSCGMTLRESSVISLAHASQKRNE